MKPVIQEIRTIVNYFDALAVGVAQGVYVHEIIEDNLSLIMNLAVDKFLTDAFSAELNLNGPSNLIALRESWREKPSTRYYADRN